MTEVPSSDDEQIALADSGPAESPPAAGDAVAILVRRRHRQRWQLLVTPLSRSLRVREVA